MVNELIALFEKQNSVNLPDFGGFMKMGNSFVFNEFLKFNDGKFIAHLVEIGIEKEEANVKITAFVAQIKEALANDNNFDLGSIGVLKKVDGKVKLEKPGSGTSPTTEKKEVKPLVKETSAKTPTTEIERDNNIQPIEVKKVETPQVKAEKEITKKKTPITEEKKNKTSIDFSETEALEKIEKLDDKQALIDFTVGDKRKPVIEALNGKLKKINKIDPTELAILGATEVKEKKGKTEEKETPIKEGSDKEVKKQVSKESDILNTMKEQEVVKVPEEKITPVVPEVKEKQEPQKKETTVIVENKEEKKTSEPKKKESPKESKKEQADKEALIAGAEKIEKEAKSRKRGRLILWIAIICIISGGSIVGYLKQDLIKGWFAGAPEIAHTETHEGMSDQEEVLTNHSATTDEEVTSEDIIVEETEITEPPVTDESEEEITEEPIIEEPEETETPITSFSIGSYHIVVGSFSKEDNASSLVETLRNEGFSGAEILGKFNGLTSVKLSSYNTLDEAKSALASSGKEGWIKKQ